MYPPEILLFTPQLEGAIYVLLIPVVTTTIDYILQALFEKKIFEPIWSGAKHRFKAWQTKRNKITADYEYSIYLSSNLPVNSLRNVTTDILDAVNHRSNDDFDVIKKKWSDDDRELDVEVTYKDKIDPYKLTLNFVPDSGGMSNQSLDAEYEPSIRSIGVNITFQFEFGKLRNSIIDLMLFARFLRDSITDLLSTRSITDGRFIVSVDNDLTLDEWIKKEQFDVSLLLESEGGRSAVEFHSDKAIISSPHTDIDDKTVEYIRATLLNYYL